MAQHGKRFDPALCEGNCPVCGAGVSVPSGSPTPMHQKAGTRSSCPGAGARAK